MARNLPAPCLPPSKPGGRDPPGESPSYWGPFYSPLLFQYEVFFIAKQLAPLSKVERAGSGVSSGGEARASFTAAVMGVGRPMGGLLYSLGLPRSRRSAAPVYPIKPRVSAIWLARVRIVRFATGFTGMPFCTGSAMMTESREYVKWVPPRLPGRGGF